MLRTSVMILSLLVNPVFAQPVATPPPENQDSGAQGDANIDRAFLTPSAEIQPKGSVTFNNYELFLMGLTYAPADQLQVTATALVPITDDFQAGALSAKLKLVDTGQLKLSAFGALFLARAGDDGEDLTSTTLGGVASFCLDPSCASLLSGSLSAGFQDFDGDDDVIPIVGAVSLVHKIARRAKLLLELDHLALVKRHEREYDDYYYDDDTLTTLSYGVRFFSSAIAGDVGLIKPIGGLLDDDDDEFPIGFPFVSFTYRSM